MQIRKAIPDDIAPVTRLLNACAASMREAGLDQWDEVYPNEGVVAADVAAGTLFVAVLDDECAGTICLNEMQSPEYAPLAWTPADRVLVVHRLAVDPTKQRRGVGIELMRFSHHHAAEAGYDAIRLDAYRPNHGALRFYEQLGYRLVGEVRFPRRSGAFNCYEWMVE
jgi:predicted N-acetyltransferase YhbS